MEGQAEAVQQRLRKGQPEAAVVIGVEDGGSGVLVVIQDAAQAETNLRAVPEVLLHAVDQTLVGIDQSGGAGKSGRRQDLGLMVGATGNEECRIHVGDGGTGQLYVQSAQHAIVGVARSEEHTSEL